MQTSEQLTAFRALCQANDLSEADIWQHKQSGNWIMSRAGAEKVQGKNNIQIEYEVCAAGIDYAIVKATATRSVKSGSTTKKLTIQTLGSANPRNCTQMSYFAEMAEKRAKVRGVLMLMGFYELGVYGEEEAEDFARSRNLNTPTLAQAQPAAARPSQPAGNGHTAPASAPTAAPAASGPNSADDEAEDFLAVAVVLDLINEAATLDDLQAIWVGEAKPYQKQEDVFAAKENRKTYLKANQTLAA